MQIVDTADHQIAASLIDVQHVPTGHHFVEAVNDGDFDMDGGDTPVTLPPSDDSIDPPSPPARTARDASDDIAKRLSERDGTDTAPDEDAGEVDGDAPVEATTEKPAAKKTVAKKPAAASEALRAVMSWMIPTR